MKKFYELAYGYFDGYYDGNYFVHDVRPWNQELDHYCYCESLEDAKSIAYGIIDKHMAEEESVPTFRRENENTLLCRYRLVSVNGRILKHGFEYRFEFRELPLMEP